MIRRLLRATVLLGGLQATLPAQRPPHEIRGSAGLACFVDEAWCDVPHMAVGFAPHLYFSRSWSFAPEFLYARGSWDYDLVLLPSLAANLRSRGAVRPYAIFGFGFLRHQDLRFRSVSGTGWSLHGGIGVRIFVSSKGVRGAGSAPRLGAVFPARSQCGIRVREIIHFEEIAD